MFLGMRMVDILHDETVETTALSRVDRFAWDRGYMIEVLTSSFAICFPLFGECFYMMRNENDGLA